MPKAGTILPGSKMRRSIWPSLSTFTCSATQGMVSPSAVRLEANDIGTGQRILSISALAGAPNAPSIKVPRATAPKPRLNMLCCIAAFPENRPSRAA